MEVADELGARTIAFPLISAGVYGWPRADAIAVAVATVAAATTRVVEARLVAFDQATFEEIEAELARWAGGTVSATPIRRPTGR